jgi:hypothetical protein
VPLSDDFWLPPSVERQFKKADPPKLGPAFGHWTGRDLKTLQLPGGGLLSFDLNRLTLADYRSMRDHYQVNASLTVLQFMIHRMDWHIECEDKKISDFIEWNMREVWTRMIRATSQAYWAGHSPIAIEWENDPNARDGAGAVVLSKFKDLIPEECKVNWKPVKGWAPPDRSRPTFYVYDGIMQQGLQWPIPTENSLWYPLLSENGDFRGKKLLRPAFSSWYFSILVHLYANRYYERFGEPIPVGRAPYDDDVTIDGSQVSGREAMERILMNLRNRSVVVLPDDRTQMSDTRSEYSYDIEYLESQMRGADFEKYLNRLDEEITLGLFTPLLVMRGGSSSGSGGGGYNLGVSQLQTFLWMLNALAGDLKEYVDKYVIDRLKSYNFGPNAPKAYWTYRGMGKENVETIRGIIVELVKGGKAAFDYDELGQALGISVKEVRQLTDPNADPNAPTDTRPARVRDDRTGKPQKGVGEPRATQRGIAARIRSTVENIYRKGNFGEAAPIRLGFRRAMLEDIAGDMGYEPAVPRVDRLYTAMNIWLADALAMAPTHYKTADEFMGAFQHVFDEMMERALDE